MRRAGLALVAALAACQAAKPDPQPDYAAQMLRAADERAKSAREKYDAISKQRAEEFSRDLRATTEGIQKFGPIAKACVTEKASQFASGSDAADAAAEAAVAACKPQIQAIPCYGAPESCEEIARHIVSSERARALALILELRTAPRPADPAPRQPGYKI